MKWPWHIRLERDPESGPARVASPEQEWNLAGTPEVGQYIDIDHAGFVFRVVYEGKSQPWGVCWYLRGYFFEYIEDEHSIPRNSIKRWRASTENRLETNTELVLKLKAREGRHHGCR